MGGLAGLALLAYLVLLLLRRRNSDPEPEPVKETILTKEDKGKAISLTTSEEVVAERGAGARSQGGNGGRSSALAGSKPSNGKKVRVVG